jgi:pilus assembly protein Flp/PilA
MTSFLQTFLLCLQHVVSDKKGATAVEYGLFVFLIAVTIASTVTNIGTDLSSVLTTVGTTLGGK